MATHPWPPGTHDQAGEVIWNYGQAGVTNDHTTDASPLAAIVPTIGGHLFLSLCFIALYSFLSSPTVIIVSHLGLVVWYPATGLIFALLLGVSPWYLFPSVFADILVGALIYHQPLRSWGETLGALGGIGCYGIAAYLLRGPIRIDPGLRHRRDVVRYVFVTLCAALAATAIGVASLAADQTISWSQFWSSAGGWFAGDAAGLLGFTPFLIVHVLPTVRHKLLKVDGARETSVEKNRRPKQALPVLEAVVQALAIPGALWFIFAGPLAAKQLYYLAYLPIIWIAMRQGVRRVVTSLVIFNFGIVLILRIFQVSTDPTKTGFLMLVISAVGLIVASTVSERHRIGRQLAERTMYLNSLIENTPLGVVVVDLDGRVQLCNDAFESLFLFRRDELLGKDINSFIVPPDKSAEAAHLGKLIDAGQRVQVNLRRKRKDGILMEIELNAVPLILDGKVGGGLAIYTDVTEREQGALRLKDQAETLRHSVAELQTRTDQATLLNEMGDFLQSCEASSEAVKVASEYGGRLFPSSDYGALFFFRSSRNVLEIDGQWGRPEEIGSAFAPEGCWALRRGHPHWSEFPATNVVCAHIKLTRSHVCLCVPMMARGETLGILHVRYDPSRADITSSPDMETWQQSQKLLAVSMATQVALAMTSLRLRESLRDQSIRDPLTGLFNRRFMQESLDRELQRARRKGRPLAVIFIDIDHFKRFNDVFGHDAGDAVLRAFAQLLTSFFRGDDVVCRYGGEEFALILPESNEQDAACRMSQFGARVKGMVVFHEDKPLDQISVSVGIAAFPEHGPSIEALLRAADQALYLSKAEGRDRISIAKR
jgi:diguanylate cyclase (GGDEF)-like protein/PAS domain S-box-containing protein